MYKIERGIPLPSKSPLSRAYRYPFPAMKIGDSFLAIGKDIKTVGPSMYMAAHRLGQKYTARSCKEGVRVWRIK